jgi:predicted DNA-binding transcriptional regulator YafY
MIETLLLLQSRGRLTAEDLAAALEVSVRTVYRDVAALNAAGVPVYGERGEGGGYQLLDGYRTNLTGLTADEASTLLLAGATGPATELGLGSLLATSRLKLLAAIPPGLRDVATRAEQRFYLDPAGWAHARSSDRNHLPTVARAVWQDRQLRLSYRRPGGRVVRRQLHPLGMVHKTGTWYLIAADGQQARIYRVDRITSVQELDLGTHRPEGFDLASFWSNAEAQYAASLPTYFARVRLGPRAQQFREMLGPLSPRQVQVETADADGWLTQTLLFDHSQMAVAALLALAPDVEALEPAELRLQLAEAARQIVDRHSLRG